MAKFKNKYRNESIRAQWWNYANDGAYFITICSADRKWIFGEIINQEMYLSPEGEIVYQEWNKSFEIRHELFCDTFVIMPNHIHAILRIENKMAGPDIANQNISFDSFDSADSADSVGSHGRATPLNQMTPQNQQNQQTPQNQLTPLNPQNLQKQQKYFANTGIAYRPPKSISSFVAGFKSAATKKINELNNTPKMPVWQSRFHDHIIRNDGEYIRIFHYIETNIENWGKDKFSKKEKSSNQKVNQ